MSERHSASTVSRQGTPPRIFYHEKCSSISRPPPTPSARTAQSKSRRGVPEDSKELGKSSSEVWAESDCQALENCCGSCFQVLTCNRREAQSVRCRVACGQLGSELPRVRFLPSVQCCISRLPEIDQFRVFGQKIIRGWSHIPETPLTPPKFYSTLFYVQSIPQRRKAVSSLEINCFHKSQRFRAHPDGPHILEHRTLLVSLSRNFFRLGVPITKHISEWVPRRGSRGLASKPWSGRSWGRPLHVVLWSRIPLGIGGMCEQGLRAPAYTSQA